MHGKRKMSSIVFPIAVVYIEESKKYQPEMTLNRLKVNEEQVVAEKLEIERERERRGGVGKRINDKREKEREYLRATTTAHRAPFQPSREENGREGGEEPLKWMR